MTLHWIVTLALLVIVLVQNARLLERAVVFCIDHWPGRKKGA